MVRPLADARFRIQAVEQMTGVPAATLRAWERRYGVPRPVRTEAAYRMYSEGDVAQVRRMQAFCNEGMSASAAAELVLQSPASRISVGAPVADAYAEAAEQIVAATRAMDSERLEALLTAAQTLGASSVIFDRVFRPALVRIGDLWLGGEITIGHEHLASELIGAASRQLLRLAQPNSSRRLALLACFADEQHVIPLYGVGFQLLDWGCRVTVLGARTPPQGLEAPVQVLKPSVVCLSTTVPPEGQRARELIEGYAAVCKDVPWLVGGRGAAELRPLIEQHGGYVVPSAAADAHELIESVLVTRGRQRRATSGSASRRSRSFR